MKRLGSHLRRLATKRAWVALVLAALSLCSRALLLPWIPVPKPAIQDEFSYLLAADTYASGRLTNPSHPLWVHFETVHLLVQPTYQSKYPPVQGLLLALGQVVFHDPWFGVWLSMGAMTAAIYWALAGWLPPVWAMAGGLVALLRVGFLNYWSESYWGGAAAAAAGALAIGAVPRLRRKPQARAAIVLGAGIALLANTRPYEGAVLAAICLGAVLMKVRMARLAAPLALILIPAAAWMIYYNYRVTGHPLRLPYMEHERQYAASSAFIWSSPGPEPHYNHESLRASYIGWDSHVRALAQQHPIRTRAANLLSLDLFFLGIPLTLCVAAFAIAGVRRPDRMRLADTMLLLFIAGLLLEVMLVPHYAAPATALVFVVAARALRWLWHTSRPLAGAVLALIVLSAIVAPWLPSRRWLFDKRDFIAQRDRILNALGEAPGKHLVLVEYGKGHDVNHEWVYNGADIDASRIVWAREMGAERDKELLDYYPGRRVWRLLDRGSAGLDLQCLNCRTEALN